MSDCAHCEHHQQAVTQLYETAIALDEAEARAHTLKCKLSAVVEALVWCMAHLEAPAWIKVTLNEAETTL